MGNFLWLALLPGLASAAQLSLRSGVPAVPSVLSSPVSAVGGAWAGPSTLGVPSLAAPVLTALPAAPSVTAVPVLSAEPPLAAPLHILQGIESLIRGAARPAQSPAALDEAKLKTLFDGQKRTEAAAPEQASQPAQRSSRPGFQPHKVIPQAVLPGGRSIPPDSFAGGYHGTDIPPEQVQEGGGFPARGPVEDWRLKEHAEEGSAPVSAFRGSTPYPTSPDGENGASYWAGEGGWVYQVSGVPTWGVNSELEGRVKTGNGFYRGSLMSEAEGAFPAQTPLECLERWGRVGQSGSGRLYVRDWVPNPRHDPAACAKFWGR